ncbi:MAG: ABC transporter permease [Promethearchaeota archaeon]
MNSNPVEVPIEYDVKSTSVRIVNNITYSSPGYVLYGPLTILSYALIILTSEKKNGIFKRLDPTGVKNHEIILSNIISNILLIFIQFFIGVIILSLFGWNPIIYSSIDAILGIILTLLVFSFFVLSIAFALAPIFKDPETAAGGVWIIIIPLAMLSGVFVPVEVFGDVMQKIVSFLPLRFAVLVLQNLLLKGLPLTYPETIESLLSLLVVSTVILLIGIKFFNKFRRN